MNARHDRSPAGPTAAPPTPCGGRPTSPALIAVDGHRIALTWLPLTGSVLVDFIEIEPRRIGTVVMRESGPGFVAQPGHFDWLRYEERETRLLRATARLREAVAFEWRSKPCP
jgi:hypothetical protein